jgi:tRNA(Arg) A34 adenosine deaminase TadA
MNSTDLEYMRQALQLAEQGMHKGDGGPFGAVIVRGQKVIGKGWNKVLATNDPTAHAEIVAIRSACENLGSYWLEDCSMYVTCEPCPMCLAAIYWARITSITFAASRDDAAELDFDDAFIYREVCRSISERTIETRQCCREDALRVMQLWPSLEIKRPY